MLAMFLNPAASSRTPCLLLCQRQAMGSVWKYVKFERYARFSKSAGHKKRIFYRHSVVFICMPYKRRRKVIRHMVFQAQILLHLFCIIFPEQIFETFHMSVLFGADHRITENHPIRPYLLLIGSKQLSQPFFLPESAQTGCQMTSCRKSQDKDPVPVNGILVCMTSQITYTPCQLAQRPRKYLRLNAVSEHTGMISHRNVFYSYCFCLPVGSHPVSSSRTDQDHRSLPARIDLFIIIQKICIKSGIRLCTVFH